MSVVQMLAPWEELRWFEAPSETLFTTPSGVIAAYNPRRVVLIFVGGAGTVDITLSRAPAGNQGIEVSPSVPPVVFTHKDHGPLASAEWTGTGAAGTAVTVYEVLLRDWPRMLSPSGDKVKE